MKSKKLKMILVAGLALNTLVHPMVVLATQEVKSNVDSKAVKSILNPNLFNISSESVVSGWTSIWQTPNRWQTKNWNNSNYSRDLESNKMGFTEIKNMPGGGIEYSIKGLTTSEFIRIVDNKSVSIDTAGELGIGQKIPTVIGKEYTVSVLCNVGPGSSITALDVDINGKKDTVLSDRTNGKVQTITHTFVANKTNTNISFFFRSNSGLLYNAVAQMSNFNAKKSSGQVAKEELEQLLPTFFDKEGNLETKITDSDLAKAQGLLNKITEGIEKNKLRETYNFAVELFNQRTALTAVAALFKDNDVTNDFIKDTVTQTSLDHVNILIKKVSNAEKNQDLNIYLARAQEIFNQKQAGNYISSLFVDNNQENDVKENVTQTMIDEANVLINKVTDEEIKNVFAKVLDRIQNLLNERIEEQNNQKVANDAVNGLFKNGNPASEAIIDDLSQGVIDRATELAEKVKDEGKKTLLLNGIKKAQTLLIERLDEEAKVTSIRESILALFQNGSSKESIREDLTQAEIDHVMPLVPTIKDSNIQIELFSQIAKAQTELNALNAEKVNDAESAVNGLFKNNDPSTEVIKGGITQEMINQAIAYTKEVLDEEIKMILEANIAIAQFLLNERIAEINRQNKATEAVNALFIDANPGTGSIIKGLSQDAVDAVQDLISTVTVPSKKEALQNTLNIAQNLLSKRIEEELRQKLAKEAVNGLFDNNDPTTNKIVKGLTQKVINAAKLLSDNVTDSSVRTDLFATIAVAESLLEQLTIENSLIAAAEKEVNALFQDNNPETGVIVEGLTQVHIDATKVIVNKVQTEEKKAELLEKIELAQKELYKQIIEKENQQAATEAVDKLFKENDPVAGIIIDGLTQEMINAAKDIVALITNTDKKAELMALVKLAQDGFNATLIEAENKVAAEKAVNELFKDDNPETGTIKDNLTQEAIDYATELTAKLTNETEQKELLNLISIAQKELNTQISENEAQKAALDAVNALYKNDTIESGSLKESTTQVELDAVMDLIEKVTNEAKKEELQTLLADAQALFTDQMNEMLVVEKFTLGKDSNVTGTLSKEITSIKLSVNGTEFSGGTISNGTFKFYAKGGKIKATTDIVTISGFNKAGDRLITKNVTVVDVMIGELTVADFRVGPSTNLTGTFSEDIKSISVDVDGKIYKGGTLNSNGTFKFYFKGNVTNINQVAVISGFDADGYEIVRTRINLLPQTPGEGYINPAPFVLTEDSNITGTYSYDVKTIEVFVDGVKYEGGTISGDGTFKFYARTIVKSTAQKVEIIAYGLDGTETGRNFIPVITPEIGSGTLAPDDVIIGETRTLTGTYTGDIASVRLVVDGVESRGGTVKDGMFTFYAAGKITKDSKDVKILGYDLRGNLLTEEVITLVDPNAVPEVTPDPEDNEEEETLPTEEIPLETKK